MLRGRTAGVSGLGWRDFSETVIYEKNIINPVSGTELLKPLESPRRRVLKGSFVILMW